MTRTITLITQFFYPDSSATGQLMTDLVRGLSQHGYAVHVVTGTPAGEEDEPFAESVKIQRMRLWSRSGSGLGSKVVSSSLFLLEALGYVLWQQEREVPVVIVSNPPYAGLLGIGFQVFRGGSYLFLLQDVFPESAVLAGILAKQGWMFRLFSGLVGRVVERSAQTIVLTDAMQRFLQRKYPAAADKLVVIENWGMADVLPREKATNPFAIQYGLDQVFTVLYSGNMGRLHDMESILMAAKLLQKEPIRWVLIGEGAKLEWVKQFCEEHELKNVLLLPPQPRELLPLTLTACDLALVSVLAGAEEIVAPSKLYSVLAAGRAVLTISAAGSDLARVVVECGVNCVPGEPEALAAAVQGLMMEPERVRKLGEAAYRLYEQRYRLEGAVSNYAALLECQQK
jgi:glycosyltransferase involved in cell wall biosynthesis